MISTPFPIKKIIVFCFFAILTIPALAQTFKEKGFSSVSNYSYKTYNAYPQCWSTTQDSLGIMYFGNGNEVLEYDGSKWRKIQFRTNGQSVTRALITDKSGVVFYGRLNDFGYLKNDSSGRMIAKSLTDYIPTSKRDFSDVWTVYETPEGYYFQARERLFRLTKTREGDKPDWIIKTWEPKTKFMFAFYQDGVYYVHQLGEGVFKMENDSLVLIPGSEFLGKERMQIMLPFDQVGGVRRYLFGSFFHGLYLYDGKQFKPFATGGDSIMRNATLYKGLRLSEGRFALATTGNGLVIIDTSGKLLQHIDRAAGLQDESIYSIYADNANNLWLALDNGIARVDLGSNFTTYNNQLGITTSVQAIARFEETIYVGTSNGFMKLNHKNNRFEFVPGLPRNQIFSLVVDGDQLLIPVDGLFSLRNNKVSEVRRSAGGDMQIVTLLISRKHPDLLFGTSTFGLHIFKKFPRPGDPGHGDWKYLGLIPTNNEKFMSCDEDPEGHIWVGTDNSVVIRFTLAFDEKGQLEIPKVKKEKFGVGRDVGGSVLGARLIHGKFYFITDTVVYHFAHDKEKLVTDNTFGFLQSKDVSQGSDLLQDYSGRVWMLSPYNVQIATIQNDSSFRIGPPTLLPVADKFVNQLYPEKGGIIWLATNEGLIRYDENTVLEKNVSLKARLRVIKAGSLFLDPQSEQAKPELSYKDNSLSFEYAAPFFDQEEKIKYQTWLEGFEGGWSDWGKNSYKEYTNLPAGSYTFHVRAINLFQRISEPALCSFIILPPWYKTWWAYSLFAIVLGGIIWMFVNVRSKRLRDENRKLEEKVSTRTAQLNESLTELKSAQAQLIQSEKMASLGELTAGIAHEIKNPLNFITNFSEVNTELLAEMKAELGKANYTDAMALADDVIENEKKINNHGKRADAIVKTMAQHSRGGQDQKEPTDINQMLDEYLMLSYQAQRSKDIAFNAKLQKDFNPSLEKIKLVPNDISRVLTNIFNNAFYSMADKKKKSNGVYEPKIEVKTGRENGMAEITVTDNGFGIPSAILNKIYQPFFTTKPAGEGTGLGLSLSYDIIKAHGGKLEVQTEEGEYTRFTILLPVS